MLRILVYTTLSILLMAGMTIQLYGSYKTAMLQQQIDTIESQRHSYAQHYIAKRLQWRDEIITKVKRRYHEAGKEFTAAAMKRLIDDTPIEELKSTYAREANTAVDNRISERQQFIDMSDAYLAYLYLSGRGPY